MRFWKFGIFLLCAMRTLKQKAADTGAPSTGIQDRHLAAVPEKRPDCS